MQLLPTIACEELVKIYLQTSHFIDRIDHALGPPSSSTFEPTIWTTLLSEVYCRPAMVQGKGHRPFIKSRKSKSSLLNIFTSYSTPNLFPFPFPPLSPFSQVRVYFVGHGNTEEVAVSSVGALPDKYQVFPFQMLQCCFSKDTKFSYVQREVCL